MVSIGNIKKPGNSEEIDNGYGQCIWQFGSKYKYCWSRKIEWLAIDKYYSLVSEKYEFYMIGKNTITRNKDSINFDAFNPLYSEYIRYAGNCKKQVLKKMKSGQIDSNNQVTGLTSFGYEKNSWMDVNLDNDSFLEGFLYSACKISEK